MYKYIVIKLLSNGESKSQIVQVGGSDRFEALNLLEQIYSPDYSFEFVEEC